ncbi:MAG TPA: hypothetical protein VFJ12_04760 [Segeticoccus sp.]|nr:hypothetical protein [Segeticoccus sp.]
MTSTGAQLRTADQQHSGGDMAGRGNGSSYVGVIVVCVVAGLAYLGIGLATGQTGFGLVGLAIMLGYALVLTVFRHRSEAVGMLAGETTDERRRDLNTRATAFTGSVLAVVLVVGFMVSLAIGSELASTFAWLAALGAVAYAAALAWLSRHG